LITSEINQMFTTAYDSPLSYVSSLMKAPPLLNSLDWAFFRIAHSFASLILSHRSCTALACSVFFFFLLHCTRLHHSRPIRSRLHRSLMFRIPLHRAASLSPASFSSLADNWYAQADERIPHTSTTLCLFIRSGFLYCARSEVFRNLGELMSIGWCFPSPGALIRCSVHPSTPSTVAALGLADLLI
jgi:hypothetical protein